MELTSLMVAALLILFVCFWFRRPDTRLPPFPVRPLPLVGHIFHLKNDLRSQLKQWRKQKGDIFSITIGGSLVVALNGYDLIHEALVKTADILSDRPPVFFDEATGIPKKGVLFSSGSYWKEQRSVSMSILRKFGMGKNIMAEKILDEVASFKEFLFGLKGKPTNIHIMLNVSVSNVICSVLFGRRFEYDNKDFQNLMRSLNSIASSQQNVSLVNFVPWLSYLPGDFFKAKKVTKDSQTLFQALTKFIDVIKRQNADSDEVNNFVDAYNFEKNKKLDSDTSTTMDDDSLKKIVLHLFEAGTETTSTTIHWCILYLLTNPKVQEKVYSEINEKVGTHRTPTIQDKSELIYLNAVIMETQRLASIVPLSLMHTCSENVTLRGYTIPKGSQIIPNLDSVLHDKTIWGSDAVSFRPERFIDDNGKLKNPEQFIPFSIGRRICLGEALAKMEMFLFLSNICQKFEFLPEDPANPPSTEYNFGIVAQPKPYKVRIVERK